MNQRIKDFLIRCTLPNDNVIDGSRFTGSLNYEKFAELIVKECAGVADKTIIGTDKVGKAIKEHFGVE